MKKKVILTIPVLSCKKTNFIDLKSIKINVYALTKHK